MLRGLNIVDGEGWFLRVRRSGFQQETRTGWAVSISMHLRRRVRVFFEARRAQWTAHVAEKLLRTDSRQVFLSCG